MDGALSSSASTVLASIDTLVLTVFASLQPDTRPAGCSCRAANTTWVISEWPASALRSEPRSLTSQEMNLARVSKSGARRDSATTSHSGSVVK